MSELGPSSVQRFLSQLAVCHVLESADEQRTSGHVLDDMRDSTHMLDRARGGHDTKCKRDVLTLHAAGDDRFKRWQIIRVNSVAEPLHGYVGTRFEAEDPERHLRPVVIVTEQVRDEAASVAEALGIGETVVGLSQFCLGLLSVFDVDHQAVPMRDPTLHVMERLSNGLNPTI